MLNNQVFYHGTIRNTIVAFGKLFSNVYIDRKQGDSVNGTTVQRLQVPLAYAPKEKWIVRIDSDPNLEGHTYTTLPRMSFEITSYDYDSSRKFGRMNKISSVTSGVTNSVFSPVPYNVNISLYVLTKTQEDALQIIEQILPTFTPEYTLSLNALPSIGIVQDVPIILDSVSVQDDYDGDFQTRRFVTHTLNFTLKMNLFGNVGDQGLVDKVLVDVGQDPTLVKTNAHYTATGNINTRLVTSENWLEDF
jgi:hypothetical protein